MLDDQWQGSSSGRLAVGHGALPVSDSDGVPDFVDYLHSLGLQLGLWMSPGRVQPRQRHLQGASRSGPARPRAT